MIGPRPPKDHRRCETSCRLCRDGHARPFARVSGWAYWRCRQCAATLLDASQLPDLQTERREYLLHENDPDSPGYRGFLNRLAAPLLERLGDSREGLDYGCGPQPALGRMLRKAGHEVRLYDPLFRPDASALERTYDFITCAEVAEHFHHPRRELARLDALLRPGGWLGIMTCFQTDDDRFADWHYRRDTTHVTFYRRETFYHLAAQFHWQCEIPVKDVVLMQKKDAGTPAGR